jgi:RNA-binding protein YlmH
LRLDAVAASGFGTSRVKMAEAISTGRVELNYQACTRPDHGVAEGDGIACRGLGKCRLTTVGGRSRKGRIRITIERYI